MESPFQPSPVVDAPSASPEITPGSDPLTNLEFDNVVGYKLSDAIRDGSKNLRQEYGWGDGVATGCALTAARVAIEGKGYGAQK